MNYNVGIRAASFEPSVVEIKEGDSVTWWNKDGVKHHPASDTGAPVSFDVGEIEPLGHAQFKFEKAGAYYYSCKIHKHIQGTVKVAVDESEQIKQAALDSRSCEQRNLDEAKEAKAKAAKEEAEEKKAEKAKEAEEKEKPGEKLWFR